MAIVRAVKSGNWSDPTVWNTGELPTADDDVYSNTFTVTIDISPTVLSISNAAATGVTAGGSFAISADGITLTCTGAGIIANAAALLQVSVSSGNSASIVSNITGGVSNSSGASHGVHFTSTGTLNITGNVLSGTGLAGSAGVFNSSTGTVNITGNCTGNVGSRPSVNNNSAGVVNITGTITGGDGTAYGATNSSTGTLTHFGTAQASATTAAIGPGAVGQVTILSGPLLSTDASASGADASGVNPCVALRWFPLDTALGTFEYRMRGATVSGSPSVRPARQLFLPDAYADGYPSTGDVRNATAYGPGGIYTGTLAVPPPESVVVGVPVDATTGPAAITAADIRAAVGLASANLDEQLAPLPNLDATISSRLASSDYTVPPSSEQNAQAVRTELSPELSRIDVATSSRSTFNPATDTVAQVALVDTTTNLTNPPVVPTTSEIADAVRVELTPELDRIDADVSSRLASVDYTAAPTALENAQAVEVQLSLPLGNLDVAVSTRSTFNPSTDTVANVTLVDTTTNLTNPPVVPTTAEIAEAVRTELTPELSRVVNCATVATTGQQIQNALSA